MIYETLEIVKDQVSKYLDLKTAKSNLVVLENVSKHDDSDINSMNDKVVLSLLNIEDLSEKSETLTPEILQQRIKREFLKENRKH